jgi:hypothetical protein
MRDGQCQHDDRDDDLPPSPAHHAHRARQRLRSGRGGWWRRAPSAATASDDRGAVERRAASRPITGEELHRAAIASADEDQRRSTTRQGGKRGLASGQLGGLGPAQAPGTGGSCFVDRSRGFGNAPNPVASGSTASRGRATAMRFFGHSSQELYVLTRPSPSRTDLRRACAAAVRTTAIVEARAAFARFPAVGAGTRSATRPCAAGPPAMWDRIVEVASPGSTAGNSRAPSACRRRR